MISNNYRFSFLTESGQLNKIEAQVNRNKMLFIAEYLVMNVMDVVIIVININLHKCIDTYTQIYYCIISQIM